MESFHTRCIFCGNEIPPAAKRGRGEHLIPKLIGGTITIKDVCRSCNSYLGAEVDHLVIQDRYVVESVFALDLPEIQNRIKEVGETFIIDPDDGSKAPAKTKGGIVKVRPRELSPGAFEADEADALDIFKRREMKNPPPGMKTEDVQRLFQDKYEPGCSDLQPGDVYEAKEIGVFFRKKAGQVEHKFKIDPQASVRIISKIAFEISLLFAEKERNLALGEDLISLRDHALGIGEHDPQRVMHPPGFDPSGFDPSKADYFHRIDVHFEPYGHIVDVTFFGAVRYRVIINAKNTTLGPLIGEDGVEIAEIRFGIHFGKDEVLPKRLGIRPVGSNEGYVLDASFL